MEQEENGHTKEGLLGSGTMPAVFAEAGMEHEKTWNHVRAVCEVSQKPSPLNFEP